MTPVRSDAARRYAIGAAEFAADALAPGLYVVATPIGNLADITLRGLATLAACDRILCEDTRTTSKLLERYAIRTTLAPYHEHNAAKVRPDIIRSLKDGGCLALVSDAGMPLVSDPGYRLVNEALAAGISVTCCPGASAVLTGLALSGLATDRFQFAGFFPQKQGERQRALEAIADVHATTIFFESPHRIVDALEAISARLPDRQVAAARELTKLHEEVLRGTAAEVAAILAARPAIKGEFTLLVGPSSGDAVASDAEIESAIDAALANQSASQAAADVARRLGLARKDVYARILARDGRDG